MPILNYTTKIDPAKTMMEISNALRKFGAKKIIFDNDDHQNPVGMTFHLDWNGTIVAYRLPCNFEGTLRSMTKDSKVPQKLCTKEQALRVGWRVVKNWIEAQLAIVQAETADIQEVFLAYAIMKDGQTVYQKIKSSKEQFLLTE